MAYEPITPAEAERLVANLAAYMDAQIVLSVETLKGSIDGLADDLGGQGMNKGIVIKAMLDVIPRESLIWGALRTHVLREGWGETPDGTHGSGW